MATNARTPDNATGTDRIVIADAGEFEPTLYIAADGAVVCVRQVPYEGQTYHTTRDRRNRPDKRSEHQLSVRKVVEHFAAQVGAGYDAESLLFAVREARGR